MKRDLDLIRKIMIAIDSYEGSGEPKLDIDGHLSDEVLGHLCLMEDGRFIHRGEVRLTWEGHEFLEASRDDGIWEKAKQIVIERTCGLNTETLKAALVQLAKDAVLGQIGLE